jgi:hypothetical protein
MSRPDYVKCIERSRVDKKGHSWCGRPIPHEFSFTSIDHAAENGDQQGRLVACPECVKSVIVALHSGLESSELNQGLQA